MVKARTTARKIKEKWKAKSWYNIIAPPAFNSMQIGETLASSPDSLINRVTEVSLQDLTNDFKKSHVNLYFKIDRVEGSNVYTHFVGHTLTSDYVRRLIRRRKTKIDGVFDVTTKDGAVLRVKPFAIADKRIQTSQERAVREVMKKTIIDEASKTTMYDFIKSIFDGRISEEIYKNSKSLYPIKRIEIYKTEVLSQPSVMIKEEAKKEEKTEEKVEEKVEEPSKPVEEIVKEEKVEEKIEEEKPEEPEKIEKPITPKEKQKLEKKEKKTKGEKTTKTKSKKQKTKGNEVST